MKSFTNKIIVLVIIIVALTTTSFAAWWGTPGYEWCLSKDITSMMTQSDLNKTVSQADFYAIILKYLKYKDVMPGKKVMQTAGDTSAMNVTLIGMMDDISDYISKTSLTPNEYRQAITYINHAEEIAQKQQKLITREELKAFTLYLSLARYKVADLIDNISFREKEMAIYSNTKYAGIFEYGIEPYYGKITRREFLILMFSLLSDQNLSEEEIIEQYNESGVLIGYENDLMLIKEITYSEMYAFLYRFEAFEFNQESVED